METQTLAHDIRKYDIDPQLASRGHWCRQCAGVPVEHVGDTCPKCVEILARREQAQMEVTTVTGQIRKIATVLVTAALIVLALLWLFR